MSVNKHKQTICDITKVILDDGVTLLQGFIEIKDRSVFKHYSDDPRNEDTKLPIGSLKNRVEFRRIEKVEKADKKVKDGLNFMDMELYGRFVERAKLKKKK